MDNKEIRREWENSFYVIEVDRDGVRKYVSMQFPRLFQYTVKINQARRFQTEELANKFINDFGDSKYELSNTRIRKVISTMTVL